MKSKTIALYPVEGLTEKQIAFVDSVYRLAEDNYSNGGDVIVECFTPKEVFEQFSNLKEVKEFMKMMKERNDEIKGEIF